MIKKIFLELVAIREELQAIRRCLESTGTVAVDKVSQKIQEHSQEAASKAELKNREKTLTCPICGASIREKDNFCLKCGSKIKEVCSWCWVKKEDNYSCGKSCCYGWRMLIPEQRRKG